MLSNLSPVAMLIISVGIPLLIIALATNFSSNANLNSIKNKPIGNGQYGTAKFADKKEISKAFITVPFEPYKWRNNIDRPENTGLVVGSIITNKIPLQLDIKNKKRPKIKYKKGKKVSALVDTGDVHCLMIGASGVGKTAHYLYPNLEYACASGVSFLVTDTKGDIYRNYGAIAKDYYGYEVSVIDLRNPTQSNGANMLHLISKYAELYNQDPNDIKSKAKMEKYAKICSKTIIQAGGETNFGQNSYFYDSAEGLLTSVIMLVAEFFPKEKRHIISVFKLLQDLLAPSNIKGKNQFQLLMDLLPPEHKARWMAGAALNTSEQAMLSVLSTAMSRLNAFLDSELEQILCFDSAIDAESFSNRKTAIFIVMPEEDPTSYFLVSLIIQQLYRELMSVADEHGGKLPRRAIFYCDEFGTIPKLEGAEMLFSAARSRGLTIVALVQGLVQLEKNYGNEGAQIIRDNCQLTIFGGFAPGSNTAETLSKDLGTQTVLSGSVSKGKESSRSLTMISRPLMTTDELRTMPKGTFITMKTGHNPMKTTFKLFLEWGITFGRPFELSKNEVRPVSYAGKDDLKKAIIEKYTKTEKKEEEKEVKNTEEDKSKNSSLRF